MAGHHRLRPAGSSLRGSGPGRDRGWQNFTCCQNCGHAESGEGVEETERAGATAIGYAFFHSQTTEGAVATGDVYLYYGAVVPGAEAEQHGHAGLRRIARTIVEALEHRGLAVDWDGSLDKAIRVEFKSQRRITRRMAERAPSP